MNDNMNNGRSSETRIECTNTLLGAVAKLTICANAYEKSICDQLNARDKYSPIVILQHIQKQSRHTQSHKMSLKTHHKGELRRL
jgi:hypothetical protein